MTKRTLTDSEVLSEAPEFLRSLDFTPHFYEPDDKAEVQRRLEQIAGALERVQENCRKCVK